MAQHVRQGVTETHAMLLYRAHDLRIAVEEFLLEKCGVRRAEAVGDYRRRVDVIEELAFIVETDDFAAVVSKLERYGGRTPLLSATRDTASYALSSGVILRIHAASQRELGAGSRTLHRQQSSPAQTGRRYGQSGRSQIERPLPHGRSVIREVRPVIHRARTPRGP